MRNGPKVGKKRKAFVDCRFNAEGHYIWSLFFNYLLSFIVILYYFSNDSKFESSKQQFSVSSHCRKSCSMPPRAHRHQASSSPTVKLSCKSSASLSSVPASTSAFLKYFIVYAIHPVSMVGRKWLHKSSTVFVMMSSFAARRGLPDQLCSELQMTWVSVEYQPESLFWISKSRKCCRSNESCSFSKYTFS